MEKEIQKKCPYKIDIGAVFTHKVRYELVGLFTRPDLR